MSLDNLGVCALCKGPIADEDQLLVSRALVALSHYDHYQDGATATNNVLSTIAMLSQGKLESGDSIFPCPTCLLRGIGLIAPGAEGYRHPPSHREP